MDRREDVPATRSTAVSRAGGILYVSFDSVLQPLVFSQVVRVVAALAREGFRYHLLSVERPRDLEKAEVKTRVEEVLGSAGVPWTYVVAPSMGSAPLAAQTLARVLGRASGIARRDEVRLVHARGYQSAMVARGLRSLLGLPYLFDARGYWIEERATPGEWFSTGTAYAMGKWTEQALFRGAHAVVTLTELQALDVASGMFGPAPAAVRVIPTCADYEAFPLMARPPLTAGGAVPSAIRRALSGKVVMGIVGALNNTYFVRETLRLAKLAVEASSVAHLLVLSSQESEYSAAIEAAGIPRGRWTVAAAKHWEMPDWLRWIDWGMLLVPETAANRAKMPTKLAEFFATGVRPMFFGCNSDVARWVARAGSGHVLAGVDDAALEAGARVIAGPPASFEVLKAARDHTASHFSLASGIARYACLLDTCLPRPRLDRRRS
ncbi:MAG TPA: glycosyltransferase [Polyangiaceae bacterium]